jgi:hypothetical protein
MKPATLGRKDPNAGAIYTTVMANKFTQDREAAHLIANTSPGFDERGYFNFM